jgi:hypothetical protein
MKFSLQSMGKGTSWRECCQSAIDGLGRKLGSELTLGLTKPFKAATKIMTSWFEERPCDHSMVLAASSWIILLFNHQEVLLGC